GTSAIGIDHYLHPGLFSRTLRTGQTATAQRLTGKKQRHHEYAGTEPRQSRPVHVNRPFLGFSSLSSPLSCPTIRVHSPPLGAKSPLIMGFCASYCRIFLGRHEVHSA